MEYYFHLSMAFFQVGVLDTDFDTRASQEQCPLSLFLKRQCLYSNLYIAECIETPDLDCLEDMPSR